jgi:ribosome biogenesis protein MAK21
MHFLDRFSYRNPKASTALRGSSLMQPLAGIESKDFLVLAGGSSGRGKLQDPVNAEAFCQKRVDNVPAEEVFFHEYFNRLGKARPKKQKKPTKDRGEDDSDGESEIWNALVQSRPELEGADESDVDLDMNDLDSEFSAEESIGRLDKDDEDLLFNEFTETVGTQASEDERAANSLRTKDVSKHPSDEDEEAFDMDASDEEAFRGSDEELPSDFNVDADVNSLLSTGDQDKKAARKKRRKLKHLPTFASAEDYATLLANEDKGT